MRITLKLGEPLWRQVGQRTLRLDWTEESATVAGVLRDLEARYPTFGAVLRGTDSRLDTPYNLFVNDHLVRWDAVATTPLHDGDTLYIFLPIVGGMGAGEPGHGRLPRAFNAATTCKAYSIFLARVTRTGINRTKSLSSRPSRATRASPSGDRPSNDSGSTPL